MSYHTNTQIFQINPADIDSVVMRQAGACLRDGGLVAFPTETVYGLGANALDKYAVARIFAAKNRPASDPIIVHIAAIDQLTEIARDIPPLAYQLAEHFWAGALTLILKRHDNIPPNVSANLETVAVRMPDHPVALALIQAAGVPVAAPSANTFTRPSPTTAAHVLEDLNGHVDIVLDSGMTTIGVESTVLDLTAAQPIILRPGGVTLESLREFIPDVAVQPRYIEMQSETAAASPGQLMRHYSPNATVILFNAASAEKACQRMQIIAQEYMAQGENVGVLLMDGEQHVFNGLPVEIFVLGATMAQVSVNLFAGLRALEKRGVNVILVRAFDRAGLGLAVWDRLLRAAEGYVIDVEG